MGTLAARRECVRGWLSKVSHRVLIVRFNHHGCHSTRIGMTLYLVSLAINASIIIVILPLLLQLLVVMVVAVSSPATGFRALALLAAELCLRLPEPRRPVVIGGAHTSYGRVMIVRVPANTRPMLSRVVDSLGWVGRHLALFLPLQLIPSVLVYHGGGRTVSLGFATSSLGVVCNDDLVDRLVQVLAGRVQD